MQSNIVIDVKGLSKTFDVFKTPAQRLFSLLFGRKAVGSKFHALEPISFSVEKGRFLGIIGQNGSGKSTLLQLISGILSPTSGSVEVKGKIAALLELGAGFNLEFTGRENARLNAQILGLSKKQFEYIFPDIQAFADIGDFIDRPVKTYSSGMFVRLAFAVQACIEPDILIVDEALAVGDIFFRLKCYERLEKLRSRGCTVILVTHSMDDVMHYCDQVLLLDHGKLVYFGEPNKAINKYYALGHVNAKEYFSEEAGRLSGSAREMEGDLAASPSEDSESSLWPQDVMGVDMTKQEQIGDGLAMCTRAALLNSEGAESRTFRQFDKTRILMEFIVFRDLEVPIVGFVIRTDKGTVVHGKNTAQCRFDAPRGVAAGARIYAAFDVPLALGSGEYIVDIGFATWPAALYEVAEKSSMAELEAKSARHCVVSAAVNFSVIPKGDEGFDSQPFYGLLGLESKGELSVPSNMPLASE